MKTIPEKLPRLIEVEIETAELWLKTGTIKVTETGNENTYYIDQFDNLFFCKNL